MNRIVCWALSWLALNGCFACLSAQEAKPVDGDEELLKKVLYAGGDAQVPRGKTAQLDLSSDQYLDIVWAEDKWELSYKRIRVMYVSLSRPSAAMEVLGLYGAAFLAKDRKCYLSVRYEDTDSALRNFYLRIPRGAGLEFLETLEKRTKRRVVYESEQVKRVIRGDI